MKILTILFSPIASPVPFALAGFLFVAAVCGLLWDTKLTAPKRRAYMIGLFVSLWIATTSVFRELFQLPDCVRQP